MFKKIFLSILLNALLINSTFAASDKTYQIIKTKCEKEFSLPIAEEKARFYAPMINRISRKYGLRPEIIAALIWHESNYRPSSTSRYGAIGLMQVIPFPGRFPRGSNPYDPEVNINTGCRILKGYLLRFNGDWQRALTAYNFGGGAVVSRGLSRSRYSSAVLRSARYR